MNRSIPLVVVCLLLGGLVVAGCGGGDEGSTAGGGGEAAAGAGRNEGAGESPSGEGKRKVEPTPESKAEYVARANGLCKRRKQQIQANVTGILKGLSSESGEKAGLSKIVDEAIAPGLEAEATGLRKLGAPRGDETQIGKIVAAIEAVVTEMREDPQTFALNPAAFAKAQRPARAYGIGACGGPA